MIFYPKSILSPALRHRTLRRKISLFRGGNGTITAEGMHFRQAEDGALVCAEGYERTEWDCPAGTKRLLFAGDRLFAVTEDGICEPQKGEAPKKLLPPNEILAFPLETGRTEIYFVREKDLAHFKDTGLLTVEGGEGGSCGCVHGERLFTAMGEKVCWSEPLSPESWERSLQQAGNASFPSEAGKILAMLSYQGKLFLFREHGISSLKTPGDTLDFRAEEIPFSGKLLPGSVRNTGEKIVFVTGDGAFSFDGIKCERLISCGYSLISSLGETASYCGKFYAVVKTKRGETCIWCLDPKCGEGHFIRAEADVIAGGDELYFAKAGGALFRLTQQGLPQDTEECTLRVERSYFGLSDTRKYLDGICIEGAGRFLAEAVSETGEAFSARGAAGTRLHFAAPVRGRSFALKLRTYSENVRIESITLLLREEVELC